MKNPKKVYRLLPCPSYDLERVESWLADMAREGLLLDKREGSATLLIRFVRADPQTVRYRLEPRGKSSTYQPPEEALGLAEEFGWEFVCPFDEFYIYRTHRSDARELNTDTAVQSAVLKKLIPRFLLHMLTQLLLFGAPMYRGFRDFCRFLATFGYLRSALVLGIGVGIVIWDLRRVAYILRLQKKMKNNVPIDHQKPWKPGSGRQKIQKILVAFFDIYLLVSFFGIAGQAWAGGRPSTIDAALDPPFATLSDLFPGQTLKNVGMNGMYNFYETIESDCARLIEWREFMEVSETGKSESIIVQYFDTDSPRLAQGLAEEFLRNDLRQAQKRDLQTETDFPPLSELGFDYAVAYRYILPTLIVRQDGCIVRVTMSDEELLIQWAQDLAVRFGAA